MGQSMHVSEKHDITPEEFDNLVRSTGFTTSEVQQLREKFSREFPKGYIDKKGFKKVYADMFPRGVGADKFAEHIFRIYDADVDGKVSFQEFVTTLNISVKGSPEDKLRSSFRLFDIDHSGSISQKELVQILTAIYKSRRISDASKRAKEDALKIMQKLDTNDDNKLSEMEFIHAATSCPMILQILDTQ